MHIKNQTLNGVGCESGSRKGSVFIEKLDPDQDPGLKNYPQIGKKWEKTSSKMSFSHFFPMKRGFEFVFFSMWLFEPQHPDTDPKHYEVLDPNPDLYTINTDLKPCFGF
jgi:hypothetical protein